jgi:hypothetical protein
MCLAKLDSTYSSTLLCCLQSYVVSRTYKNHIIFSPLKYHNGGKMWMVIIYKMHIFFIITNTKVIATWGKKEKKRLICFWVHRAWSRGHTLCLLPRQREITTARWWSTSNHFPWDPTVRIVCVVSVGLVTTTTPQAGSWPLTTTACGGHFCSNTFWLISLYIMGSDPNTNA